MCGIQYNCVKWIENKCSSLKYINSELTFYEGVKFSQLDLKIGCNGKGNKSECVFFSPVVYTQADLNELRERNNTPVVIERGLI